MPIFSYRCEGCGFQFEELVRKHDETVTCPKCKGLAVRTWAGEMYSSTGKPSKNCNGKCSECSGCH